MQFENNACALCALMTARTAHIGTHAASYARGFSANHLQDLYAHLDFYGVVMAMSIKTVRNFGGTLEAPPPKKSSFAKLLRDSVMAPVSRFTDTATCKLPLCRSILYCFVEICWVSKMVVFFVRHFI